MPGTYDDALIDPPRGIGVFARYRTQTVATSFNGVAGFHNLEVAFTHESR